MLSESLVFQPAAAGDISLLLSMMQALYEHEAHPFDVLQARGATLALLSSPIFGNIWLLRREKEYVGYLVLTFGFSLEFGGRDALLDELFIVEPHRSKGLGRQALQFVFAHCREQGIHALHLEVLSGNDTAPVIYSRFGFNLDDRKLMTKWLD